FFINIYEISLFLLDSFFHNYSPLLPNSSVNNIKKSSNSNNSQLRCSPKIVVIALRLNIVYSFNVGRITKLNCIKNYSSFQLNFPLLTFLTASDKKSECPSINSYYPNV